MKKSSQEINFSTAVKYKEQYYLTAMHMNALFMYNEKNDKLTFLTSFQREQKQEALYLKAFLYKNEIWFIPCQADQIAIVNLENLSVEYMPLLYHEEYHKTYIKYTNVLYFKDKFLCLIPNDVDAVMLIDLERKKAKAYYGIVEAKKNYHGAVYYEDKICFFPWQTENVLILNLKTNERVYRPWEEKRESFADAVYDKKYGQVFFAPARESYIRVDSIYDRSCKKIKLDDFNEGKCKTYYATDNTNELFFWGNKKNIVIKINKENYKVKQYIIPFALPSDCFFPIYSDDVEALACGRNYIIRYDAEKDVFDSIYINIMLDTFLNEMLKLGVDMRNIVGNEESNFWQLQQFVPYIQIEADIRPNYKKTCIGKLIYENICVGKEPYNA